MNRWSFLRATGLGIAGALAGCFTPVPQGGGAAGLIPMGGNVAAGGVGSGYTESDLVEADADYTAATADQLDAALDTATPENPVIVWVPWTPLSTTPAEIGRSHSVVASTKSVDHRGGIIYSNSMGSNSTNYRGGSADLSSKSARRSRTPFETQMWSSGAPSESRLT